MSDKSLNSFLPGEYESYVASWEEKIASFIQFEPGLGGTASQEVEGPASSAAGEGSGDREEAAALIRGLPFAVKDNIAVKGFSLSCGSKLLAGLTSPYTATAVQRLERFGCQVVGKTNLDEFGMGSSTDNSGIQKTNNPWDTDRVPGGSSGGSAAAVAAGLVPFALGSDTGGSVRQPASFCGVVGLKPGYGAVSRYGLVAYASSLEGIGVLADSVKRTRAVFAVTRGSDPLDQTSLAAPPQSPGLYGEKKGPRVIGVLSAQAIARAIAAEAKTGGDEASSLSAAAQAAELEPAVERAFALSKDRLRALGHTLEDIEIPGLKYGVPAYYTIAMAEASANLARFDGIRYGRRPPWAENPDELMDKTRDMGFGNEVKLRILLGTFVLRSGFQDRYYLRAQRIRAEIRKEFEALLGTAVSKGPFDAILMPVFPTRAFGRGDAALSPFAQKAADLYTCCANLAGLPALSFPASLEDGLPVGVQLLGRAFSEGTLLDIAEGYEEAHPFPHPEGYRAFWP
ncbi:MAG: aspartyl/glutamyl-tRNA amidotransferase subunit A [Spirochaetaceae bacterium]|jgi:aspartyl-tRNA(Asn)/glutamyl-tRNA(Gln) amidotransferase subunit A|nr:aspartyl/glutamyl-tRNA amidotransferase subunit A [Spirochaetaceae bacterium]